MFNRFINVLPALIILFVALGTPLSSHAAGDYVDHPKLKPFIDDLEKNHQFDRASLEQLFSDVKRKDSILKAISRTAESKPWKDYRPIFVTSKRAKLGLGFWHKHQAALQKAQQTYGVPAEIIVAILGVETRYGKNRGSYRVIDSLATLGFDYPKRSKFFSSELKQFLLLCREQGFDPKEVKGSYAGAMGYPQFISSSYRHYAVDFDNDGIIDLLNNPTDAIGSIANYFKVHGWKKGAPIVSTATISKSGSKPTTKNSASAHQATLFNTGLKPSISIGNLKAEGIHSTANYEEDQMASAMMLEGEKGSEYWLGLTNFYVITRYNHSKLYAMAVYQLSQDIKSLMVKDS